MIHAIIFAKITSEKNSSNEPVLVIRTSFEYAVISCFLFISNEKENVNYIISSGCDIFCMLVIVRIWWVLVLCVPHSICAIESTQEARTRNDRVDFYEYIQTKHLHTRGKLLIFRFQYCGK